MFLVKPDVELSLTQLGEILNVFQTRDLPKLQRYYNYYKGNQDILYRRPSDVGKYCNNIVANYVDGIVSNYTGYLTANDISYQSDEANFDQVQKVLKYNDCHSVDSDYLRDACIYGKACEIMWVDNDGEIRFKTLDPRETIDVYDDTLDHNLIYGIRFYVNDLSDRRTPEYYVEVYDNLGCKKYKSAPGFRSFELIEEVPHYFGQVPITFFTLNKEEDSVFDRVITLQNAYNTLLSSSIDDWESFCDAYLVFKNVIADEEDLIAMKKNRTLMLDGDADASYLTKNINDTQIQHLLDLLNDQIHTISFSPDFNDEKFVATSGIALRYKLFGFMNNAASIEAQMKKALQRRIELICGILGLKGEEIIWRDCQIIFNHNLPIDDATIATMVVQLKDLVSDETLLAQLPFITDPAAEYERLKKQKEENKNNNPFLSSLPYKTAAQEKAETNKEEEEDKVDE